MIGQTDVAIVGGGLAGLTLALQLRQTLPTLQVTVFDQRSHPAPEKKFKVGESMVEVSSWYLRETLDLGAHLIESHLPKFGLRFFISNGKSTDLGRRPEYGLFTIPERPQDLRSGFPGVHLTTYNVDRGRLENHLFECCREAGVEVLKGCKVNINLGRPHEIAVKGDLPNSKLRARWVIDATGQTGLLARQLGLRNPKGHFVNAVWFRLKGRIDPDRLTEDNSFHSRIFPNLRWLSTNHFMGSGYWIWLIPLPDEATSMGIMIDPSLHSFQQINHFEGALNWLLQHEPSLAKAVSSMERLDFRVLKAQAYLSRQTLSTERWALSGESAFFSDALYSPGGDFIAVSNTLITQIIAADCASDHVRLSILVRFGEQLLRGMFRHYMGLYRGSYQLMGRPGTMLQKVAWDTAVYFGYNVLLFRNGCFCNPEFHSAIRKENAQLERLQKYMIRYFQTYEDPEVSYAGKFVDQACLEPVQSLYLSSKSCLDAHALKAQLRKNLGILEHFAENIVKVVA
jgi:flavin-dependent dehydrogenase